LYKWRVSGQIKQKKVIWFLKQKNTPKTKYIFLLQFDPKPSTSKKYIVFTEERSQGVMLIFFIITFSDII